MVIPTFGPILKATRVALRLSRAELAARAGLDESAIGHFERGFRSPTYTSAAALAAALGVSLDWFLPGITRGVFGSPELALVRAEAIAETERWARDEASNSGGLEEAPPSSSAAIAAGPDASPPEKPTVLDAPQPTEREQLARRIIDLQQRLAPITDDENRRMVAFSRRLERQGADAGGARLAALERLETFWRSPEWKKRAATIASERRSAARPAQGTAGKRRRHIGTAEAEEGRRAADQVPELKPAKRRRGKPAGQGE